MLELRSVSFSYDGARQALEDVSLRVGRGERVAVLGHNGSGKSTLVKIMGALQVPSRGACFISGRDAQDLPFRELRGLVGVVFQDPENQIVGAVVEDDAAFAPENQGLPPQEIQARVDWALERVGMRHKRRAMVSALSGGEKQRVALAGALAARVRCLILDEPTTGLDPVSKARLHDLILARVDEDATIVMTTHDLAEAERIASRVLIMSRGRIIADGSVTALRERLSHDAEVTWVQDGEHHVHATAAPERFLAQLDLGAITGLTVTRPTLEETYLALVSKEEQS